MKAFGERSHNEMKDVLMDPGAPGPEVHYYMIRGGDQKRNITVWESGEVGGEYIKTYGHYHVMDFVETYEVLAGEGIFLLQNRKKGEDGKPIDDEVEYVKAIFAKPGTKIVIPERAGHLGVNIGSSWLVTRDDSPVNMEGKDNAAWPEHADYSAVKKMQGFAYYIVNENGKPKFVKNPKYRNTPEIVIE
jgi:oxalate decarboxylase/phosphoglucose isomerase-like protein (cupin superfamily)